MASIRGIALVLGVLVVLVVTVVEAQEVDEAVGEVVAELQAFRLQEGYSGWLVGAAVQRQMWAVGESDTTVVAEMGSGGSVLIQAEAGEPVGYTAVVGAGVEVSFDQTASTNWAVVDGLDSLAWYGRVELESGSFVSWAVTPASGGEWDMWTRAESLPRYLEQRVWPWESGREQTLRAGVAGSAWIPDGRTVSGHIFVVVNGEKEGVPCLRIGEEVLNCWSGVAQRVALLDPQVGTEAVPLELVAVEDVRVDLGNGVVQYGVGSGWTFVGSGLFGGVRNSAQSFDLKLDGTWQTVYAIASPGEYDVYFGSLGRDDGPWSWWYSEESADDLSHGGDVHVATNLPVGEIEGVPALDVAVSVERGVGVGLTSVGGLEVDGEEERLIGRAVGWLRTQYEGGVAVLAAMLIVVFAAVGRLLGGRTISIWAMGIGTLLCGAVGLMQLGVSLAVAGAVWVRWYGGQED